ncbi:hypothetical protein [Flavobacterium pectinovorum]|uniref:Uncharacterized protein n=1 Tax=Flavobacterium pectinovorum TaxID=29533 RepID=A0AB36P4T5_9FLAO|nr:hypothetical protein [Flavobacterium pectinovorum]OXB07027.1 hypothetical protein B0A72_04035 [Flavobacterium pectinovorum]SHN13989.1 hypothetical protein SAMN05444387_4257 [Flavobacterium pectinovorum]
MIKKGITLFILMLFVFQNAGSIWIIGDFYLNQDYISKNVCINRFDTIPICNGKCYLENKLKANDKEEQKFPTVTYKEVQLFLEAPADFSFTAIYFSFEKKYPVMQTDRQKSNFIFSIYHPPRCG